MGRPTNQDWLISHVPTNPTSISNENQNKLNDIHSMWANTAFFFPRKGLFFLKLQDFYIKTLYFCGPHQTEAPCVDFRLPRLNFLGNLQSVIFTSPTSAFSDREMSRHKSESLSCIGRNKSYSYLKIKRNMQYI